MTEIFQMWFITIRYSDIRQTMTEIFQMWFITIRYSDIRLYDTHSMRGNQ